MKKFLILFLLLFLIYTEKMFSQTPIYYNNFPLLIDQNRRPFQKAGIPLITDLDKDGQKEIVFLTLDYNAIANPPLLLYVINSDGSNFSNFPKGYNELIHDIASGDVNGDGYLDIALRMAYSFDIIDRFGNSLPGFPVNYSDGDIDPSKFISLYDLDNDGKLEIIVSKIGEVCVFNFDGTIRSGWPRHIPGRAKYNPAIGDIDNDGYAEIILNSFRQNNSYIDSGAVNIFRNNGESFSTNWPVYLDSLYYSWSSSPSLYIDYNNPNSTFIAVNIDKILTEAYGIHRFMKFDIQSNIDDSKYYNDYMDYGTLVLGDINRNGEINFASGTQYGITFSAFDNHLLRTPGWPRSGQGEHWATGEIGKLSFENNLNVITNTWHTFNPNGYGYIYAYTQDGINLPWSPLRPEGLVNGISFADLNNDGSVELIATSRSATETFLHVWTIPGIPYTKENFPWPQYGHDRYRTNQYGFVPPDEPVGIQPNSTIVPDKFNLYQNFPNPFNPTTNIKFEIKSSSLVKLTIFDALGQTIETLVNEQLHPGTYQLTFDGGNYTSGVYFYRLVAEDFVETKKMLLVK